MDNIRLLIISLLFVQGAIGLNNLKVTVPKLVRSGDIVWLTCNYDLEGKKLHTVKWFFNDQEFYRYAPKKEPPSLVLPLKNINVNLTISNKYEVVLFKVSKKQSGIYKCEATEDPTLAKKTAAAHMTVVDVPGNDPILLVQKQRLAIGETLRANCTSGSSVPAPIIRWTLNGEPIETVTKLFNAFSTNITIDPEKVKTLSELEVTMSNEVFQNGRLLLRCFANIDTIYQATAEIEIREDASFIASIVGNIWPHSYRTNGCRAILSESLGLAGMSVTFILATCLSRL